MGSRAPLQFNVNDGLVLTTGFLPEISYDLMESEIRRHIVDVLHNDTAESMSLVTADDFQLVTVKGKKATILTCLCRNFKYSGKILKQTAGNGPVYIRLTSSLIKQSRVTCSPLSSDSDFDLPDASSIYNKSKPEVILISDNSDDDSNFELPHSIPSTSRGHNHSYQSLPLQCSTPKTVQSTTYTPSPSSNTSNTLQSPLPVSTETPSTSRGRNRSYRSLSLHLQHQQFNQHLHLFLVLAIHYSYHHHYQYRRLHQLQEVTIVHINLHHFINQHQQFNQHLHLFLVLAIQYSYHHHYQYQLRLHQLQEVAIIHTNLYHFIIQHQQFNQLLALAIH